MDVRLLIGRPPNESRLTERDEPQSLHDPDEYVRGSIEDWPTPTAVLLGADGLLAGGPVSGDRGVGGFVRDVYESLHGVPPRAPDGQTRRTRRALRRSSRDRSVTGFPGGPQRGCERIGP